ncbi:MAG: asparaginase [Candidatus Dormibacteria bacterium]
MHALGAALLAEVWRGPVLEAAIRGHIAVVDRQGGLVAWAGDPDVVTAARSTVKPLQAIPFVRLAVDPLGVRAEELAVACASHQGEPRHVETVRSLLARAGVGEEALCCGPQQPYSTEAARTLVAAGQPFLRVHNNCSGKHAAMLATCRVAGWPLEGYAGPDHPMQRAVAAAWREVAGVDLAGAPSGIDGCGLPTFGLPLRRLAGAFAQAATSPEGSFRRCQDAMAAHPFLVGGSGRFDSALLAEAGTHLTAKSGGGAIWCAVLRPAGPAVALKLEAGHGEQLPPVALAVLRELGISAAESQGLANFARPMLRNWVGEAVGETRTRVRLEHPS